MFLNTDQFTAASKTFIESQLAAFNELATIALQGTEKIIELNSAATQACIENCAAATKDLMEAKDPQAFFSLATAYAKPSGEQAAAYSRQLADIASTTKAGLAKVIDARVADVQGKLASLDYSAANNAPADFQTPLLMMKSMMDKTASEYGQFFKTARHAADLMNGQMAGAANLFAQVPEKTNTRAARK